MTIEGQLIPDEVARCVTAASHNVSETRAEGNLTIAEFITLLQSMLSTDQPSVVLVPRFPKYLKVGYNATEETVDNPTQKIKPTITYHIMRREIATTGGNKQPFGTGVKEMIPRERMRVGQSNGEQTIIYGQNFDNLVKFDIWSLTNTEAEELVNWFEQYLRARRVFFRNQGLGEILFWYRNEDETIKEVDNRFERRSLVFYVRTEELFSDDEVVLKNLQLSAEIGS